MNKVFPFLNWLPLAKKSVKNDLIAGITGTIIVIPQAVAFAIIAGLPPIYGFYTAMITPIIAALFGSSYHLISGPTTAISIVVYATLTKLNFNPETDLEVFISMALVLTFLAGLFQFLMGLLRMGKLVNFVSNSVIIGFTSGAGILIAFKQLKYIFGLDVPQGSTIVKTVGYLYSHISEANGYVFLVATGTLLIAILIRLIRPLKRYYMLIAMILGSFIAISLGGSAVGISTLENIPSGLPSFDIPDITFNNIQKLSSGAMTVALLGLISSIAIGKSIALKTHQKIDNNQEFIGQGLSNLVGSFFSSYTGAGSFSRSGVNHQVGAKTPMSAIYASAFLIVVLLFFAKYTSYLPKATMGGIIFLVGIHLIDFKNIKRVYKSSGKESIVLFVTLIGTLFFDLEFALLAGILTSFFFYFEKTSKPNIAIMAMDKQNRLINKIRDKDAVECSSLKIVRIDGSLYFGSIEKIANFFAKGYNKNEVQHVLIVAEGINFIDLGAAEWLTNEVLKWQKTRGGIYITGLKIISQDILKKGGFIDKMGHDIFYKDKKRAIAEIHKKIKTPCKVKAFEECN